MQSKLHLLGEEYYSDGAGNYYLYRINKDGQTTLLRISYDATVMQVMPPAFANSKEYRESVFKQTADKNVWLTRVIQFLKQIK